MMDTSPFTKHLRPPRGTIVHSKTLEHDEGERCGWRAMIPSRERCGTGCDLS